MLTEAQVSAVHRVFERVSSMFTYQTDLVKYGEVEHWADVKDLSSQIAARKLVGDCDDFALACRHLLNEAGVPNRLVLCTIDGEGHLICEAEGYILDNTQQKVVRVDDLKGYNLIKMSGYKKGDPWTLIEQ